MLLQPRKADLNKVKRQKLEYINSLTQLISKNFLFFIKKVATAAHMYIPTGQAFCQLMKAFSSKSTS